MVSTEDCQSKGRGINPSLSFSFSFIQKNLYLEASSLLSPKLVSSIWMHDDDDDDNARCTRREKGTPGELRKKNRQAFQEWLRERLSVRFEDD